MNANENTEELIKDLCSRLPYGVKVNDEIQGDFTLIGLTNERILTTCEVEGCHNDFPIENIKPYLFPLSSMTVEQRYELHDLIRDLNMLAIDGEIGDWIVSSSEIDWYNKYHFDYRGLIEKGLAIDATGKNVY